MTRCATRNSLPSLFFQLWEEKISLSPRPRDPGVIASLRELNFKTRTRWWITWQAIFLMAILSSLRELCEKGRIKKIVQGWAENKKSKSLMNRMTSDILLREFSKKKKKQKKELNTPRTFLNERFNHSSNYWYEHFINKLPFLFVRKKKREELRNILWPKNKHKGWYVSSKNNFDQSREVYKLSTNEPLLCITNIPRQDRIETGAN